MTINTQDEEKIISHMKDSRRFNVRNIRDWLDLSIKTVAVLALVGTSLTFAAKTLIPEWVDMPQDLNVLATEVSALRVQIDNQEPQLLDFRGQIIVPRPLVEAGDSISMTAVMRRNLGCETTIRVRFFDHDTNSIASAYSYEMPTVKAPVSRSFNSFSWQILIPEALPPGQYSYFPEIIPEECGVYKPLVPPMSNPFVVVNSDG